MHRVLHERRRAGFGAGGVDVDANVLADRERLVVGAPIRMRSCSSRSCEQILQLSQRLLRAGFLGLDAHAVGRREALHVGERAHLRERRPHLQRAGAPRRGPEAARAATRSTRGVPPGSAFDLGRLRLSVRPTASPSLAASMSLGKRARVVGERNHRSVAVGDVVVRRELGSEARRRTIERLDRREPRVARASRRSVERARARPSRRWAIAASTSAAWRSTAGEILAARAAA